MKKTANQIFSDMKWRDLLSLLILSIGINLFPLIKIEMFAHDFFFTKWAITYGTASLLTLSLVSLKRSLTLPKFSNPLILSLIFLFIVQLVNHIYAYLSLLSTPFMDRIFFVVLTFSIFHLFQQGVLTKRIFMVMIASSTALFLVMCLLKLGGELSRADLSLTFGNINMSAEFVGMGLAVMLGGYQHTNLNLEKRILDGLIVASMVYLYYASSRSIVVSLGCVFATLIFLRLMPLKKIIYLIAASLVFIVFIEIYPKILILLNPLNSWSLAQTVLPEADFVKASSTLARWQIIKTTLQLIWENPLGIGPGNFLYAYIPYIKGVPAFNEGYILQSPHNEYLRFLAEDGIFFVFGMIIACWFLIKDNIKKIGPICEKNPMIVTFFTFMAIQSLFQFPLINGVPFFICACFTGYLLAELYVDQVVYLETRPSFFLGTAMAIVLCFFCFARVASEWLEFFHRDSISLSRFACRLNDSNADACMNQARAEIGALRYADAKETILRELVKRPHNFVALSILASVEFYLGNMQARCVSLKKIDDYFRNESSYHAYIQENCS